MTDTPTLIATELRALAARQHAELDALADRIELLPVLITPRFPGDPGAGKIRWGCSYNSNAVPAPHENAAGVPVGVRRTFWDMGKVSSLVATAKADLAAGRIPLVSVKLGTTWKNVAAGAIDAALLSMFKQLDALGGPVWFIAHHEPEGGNGTPYPDDGQGTEINWRAMQTHIRELLTEAGTKNIAFGPCLMSWTYDSRSGRKPADWWVDGVWDFAGIDHYVEASSTELMTTMWDNALAFYTSKGLPIVICEWGNKDHTTTGANEMQAWYDHLLSVGAIGACYFDTSLNGGVPLSGAALTKFRQLMAVETSVYG